MRNLIRWTLLLALSMFVATSTVAASAVATAERRDSDRRHVLLISVDGLHASDLARWVERDPQSALAQLAARGTTYANPSAPVLTDSFPGTLALTTGGTPKTTGVYYDDSYDRSLYTPGSNCRGTPGTEVLYDESIDYNPDSVHSGGMDPAKLPLKKTADGCVPLYPHQFLRANTIFNVAPDAGLRTAWSDKHPSYDILNGPEGNGVDDLYTPEIGATVNGTVITDSVQATEAYDALKVHATLDQIDGMSSTGSPGVGVPALFGMNFQAVSVAQKLPVGGYVDDGTRFSPELADALRSVSRGIGRMVTELRERHLLARTEIIVTAKHGQSPIDRDAFREVDPATIPNIVNSVQPNLVAQATQDDISLLWLNDQSKTSAAVAALRTDQRGANTAQIARVIAGSRLRHTFGDPRRDPRVPDIVVQPEHGVVYSTSTSKIAEHGGATRDDRHVALLVVRGFGGHATTISQPVDTTQVAPSVLDFLGLDPHQLQAVRQEQTPPLPATPQVGLLSGDRLTGSDR